MWPGMKMFEASLAVTRVPPEWQRRPRGPSVAGLRPSASVDQAAERDNAEKTAMKRSATAGTAADPRRPATSDCIRSERLGTNERRPCTSGYWPQS